MADVLKNTFTLKSVIAVVLFISGILGSVGTNQWANKEAKLRSDFRDTLQDLRLDRMNEQIIEIVKLLKK